MREPSETSAICPVVRKPLGSPTASSNDPLGSSTSRTERLSSLASFMVPVYVPARLRKSLTATRLGGSVGAHAATVIAIRPKASCRILIVALLLRPRGWAAFDTASRQNPYVQHGTVSKRG